MKHTFLLFVTILHSFWGFTQISQKELDDVSFQKITDAQNGTIYGFSMDGKLIGPSMNIKPDGTTILTYYNKDGLGEGFQMMENPKTGMRLLAEIKDNQLNGNVFKMTGKQLDWAQTYKNGKAKKDKGQLFKSQKSNWVNCVGNCADGFGVSQPSKGNIAMGFHLQGLPIAPVIYIYGKDTYMGDMRKGWRHYFGKYQYNNDGSFFIGMWEKGKRSGLGMWFEKDGSIREKGYYKKDELIKNM